MELTGGGYVGILPGKRKFIDCILLVDYPPNVMFAVHFLSVILIVALVFMFTMLVIL